MIELTSPDLKPCIYCNSEPIVERGFDWHNLNIAFLRVKCTKCTNKTYWSSAYTLEDNAGLQQAIDETSQWWNNQKINWDEEVE